MKEYIKQAAEIGTFETVGFSGGEAILHFDHLRDCAEYASSFGFRVTLVTNGFWGQNRERGTKMISELVDAGLKSVSFSVDKFHQEFVPIETVSSAMRICEEFGVFSSATLMDQSDMSSVPATVRALRSELYGKDIVIYPVFPAGGGAGVLPESSIIRECKAIKAICPFETGLTVMFDGSVRMCCSQFSDEIPMTCLGQFDEMSLPEVIEAFNKNDFIYVLLKKQFAWFVERTKELGVSVAEKYSVPCELCHELFTNGEFMRRLAPAVKEEAFNLRFEKVFG
jgi:MoaA/NifB/PqqE/SkfB family radical SAM enzyme